MQIEGKIIEIGETQQVSDRFRKRELVLEHGDDPEYPEELVFEFVQGRVDLLDGYHAGQTVAVWFDISGRKWQGPQGVKRFISLKGWRLQAADAAPNPIPDEPPVMEDPRDEIPF